MSREDMFVWKWLKYLYIILLFLLLILEKVFMDNFFNGSLLITFTFAVLIFCIYIPLPFFSIFFLSFLKTTFGILCTHSYATVQGTVRYLPVLFVATVPYYQLPLLLLFLNTPPPPLGPKIFLPSPHPPSLLHGIPLFSLYLPLFNL
jgi:hypothetical protein